MTREQKRILDITPEQLRLFLRSLIGLERDKALEAIYKEGFRSRVFSVNGSPLTQTQTKFDDSRINLELIRGKVTRAFPG